MSAAHDDEALIRDVAKRIFVAEHPKSDWLVAPNYVQAQRQERYLRLARAIVVQVREATPTKARGE